MSVVRGENNRTGPTRNGSRASGAEVVQEPTDQPLAFATVRSAKYSGRDGRQALAVATFAKLEVLGFERIEYELTSDAVDLGLDRATGRGRARDEGR